MSEKIYLTEEEQRFLMDWLEFDNPTDAAEQFVYLMMLEKAEPKDTLKYLKRIMKEQKWVK